MEGACTGDFIRNGDISIGDSRFWKEYGTVSFNTIIVDGDNVLKFFDRTSSDHGLRQDLYLDQTCFQEYDRWLVQAKYKIEDSSGNALQCDLNVHDGIEECAIIRLWTTGHDNTNHNDVVAETVVSHYEAGYGDWTLMSGIYTLEAAQADHSYMYIFPIGPHQDNTVIVDSISVVPLTKTCEQSIVNPSFVNGTSDFWERSDRAIDISVVSPGADDNYSILL